METGYYFLDEYYYNDYYYEDNSPTESKDIFSTIILHCKKTLNVKCTIYYTSLNMHII